MKRHLHTKRLARILLLAALALVAVVAVFYITQPATAAFYNPSGQAGSWDYRQEITIESGEVDTNLTDFPVYVDLSDMSSGFFNNVQTDGADIRVTTADGATELAREVVSVDISAETGELHFKADDLSATEDTSFYIYYGNSSVSNYAESDTYGSQNVWTNGYVAVLHAALNGADSTGNQNDFTPVGDAGSESGGKFGSYFSFDGSGDYYDIDSMDDWSGLSEYTISAWTYLDNLNSDSAVFSTDGNGAPTVFWYNVGTNGGVYSLNEGNTGDSGNRANGNFNPSLNTWQMVQGVFSSGNKKILINGSFDAEDVDGALTTEQATSYRVGSWSSANGMDASGRYWEVRLASVARSDAWNSTEYANQNTPATFYAVGAQEVDVTPPSAPQNLAAELVDSGVKLTWSPPADDGGASVSDYIVEYQTSSGGSWSVFADGTSTSTTATVTGLSNDTSYDFRVAAENSAGQGPYSSVVSATPGEPAQVIIQAFPDTTTPSIETDVRITNEGSQEYEYQYTWCVTDAVDNDCGGGDDVFSSTAAKLIQPGENFDTTLNSNVPNPGDYHFHLSVNYGSASSTAHQSFAATEQAGDGTTFGDDPSGDFADADWQYRQKITIKSSEVDTNLTDFPVYVDLADLGSPFFSNVNSDGSDIRMTAGDGTTELAREVVSVDTGTETGEVHFKADSLSASQDTSFYMYYGNSQASNYGDSATYGAENVWTNGFAAVYHTQQVNAVDSTANGGDGTANGSPQSVAAVLGQGVRFSDEGDRVRFPSLKSHELYNGYTISFNLNYEDSARYDQNYGLGGLLEGFVGTGDHIYSSGFRIDESKIRVFYDVGNDYEDFGAVFNSDITGVDTFITATYDGDTIRVYQDETLIGSKQVGQLASNNEHDLVLGEWGGGYRTIGTVDELRIYDRALSSDSISTARTSQNDPSSFYTAGLQETEAGGGGSGTGGGTIEINGGEFRGGVEFR